MKIIFKNFYKIFEEEGVKPIESKGKKYDPYIHEVIKLKESSEEEGMILKEIQKGYLLNDNILRHPKVIVSNGGDEK